MTLKSDLIAQAQSVRDSALAAYEQAIRDLVVAENSPDDWVISVISFSDATGHTLSVNGMGWGMDLSGCLQSLGFAGAETYSPIGGHGAVIKSVTQPADIEVINDVSDGDGGWITQDPVMQSWSKL